MMEYEKSPQNEDVQEVIMDDDISDFMKVKEVAKRMNVTPDFIYKKIRTDPKTFKFAIVNVGGVILINRRSYEMWCESVSKTQGLVE